MKADFVKKVQIFMERYSMITKGARVLVGLSGGADSVCLLLALHALEKEMEFSLAAVHVEHGIRGAESLADAVFAEKLCADLGVPFRKFSVDAPAYAARMHRSPEEAARELRYRCLEQACTESDFDTVAVAHHLSDNAETMLFHLARGSGIRGVSGIPPVTAYHDISVIRPLLGVTRAEIEKYLSDCGQSYRVDSTNADVAYTRNRIRGRVLPELETVNAQAVAHMGKTAGWLREICDYLDEAALSAGADAYKVVYRRCLERAKDTEAGETAARENSAGKKESPVEKVQIFSQSFLTMHRVLQSTLVHYLIGLIAGSEKDVTSGHVEQVMGLFAMREGKRTDLPYGVSARRVRDGVELYHRTGDGGTEEETDVYMDLPVPGEVLLENGAKICAEILNFDGNFEKIPKKRYTKWMDYDKIKGTVQLRTRRPGDYLQIDARGGQKKLKRYFIDEKIPTEERGRILLVTVGSHVLWVIGHRISEACKVTEKTRRVLCLTYQSSDKADICQEMESEIS